MGNSFSAECADFVFRYHAESSPSGNLSTSHCHDYYEILYVVDGKGRYLIEGAEYEMRPQTLMIVRPYEYHCVEVEADAPYERYVLHFSTAALAEEGARLLAAFTAAEKNPVLFYPPHALTRSLSSVFERFEEAAGMPQEKKDLYARTLLCEIVVLLSAANADSVTPDPDDLGVRVIRYLNDHIDREIRLDWLARQFFVSKYYLCRAFKKRNGISIHGYLTQKRVMYAKQLMESGESASGAAYRVGFGDYSAFYRAYVKVTGTSPVTERKRNDE